MVIRRCIEKKKKGGWLGHLFKKANSEIAAPKRFFRRMQEAPAFVTRVFKGGKVLFVVKRTGEDIISKE